MKSEDFKEIGRLSRGEPTDQQLIETIAKWCGTPFHKPTEQEIASGSYYQYEPNYLTTLDAIQGAVMGLSESQTILYNHKLMEIACDEIFTIYDDITVDCNAIVKFTRATPRQRALALYKVIKDLVAVEQKKGGDDMQPETTPCQPRPETSSKGVEANHCSDCGSEVIDGLSRCDVCRDN